MFEDVSQEELNIEEFKLYYIDVEIQDVMVFAENDDHAEKIAKENLRDIFDNDGYDSVILVREIETKYLKNEQTNRPDEEPYYDKFNKNENYMKIAKNCYSDEIMELIIEKEKKKEDEKYVDSVQGKLF